MDTSTIRVVKWLRGVQTTSQGRATSPSETRDYISTLSAPVGSYGDLTLPLPLPRSSPTPSESTQDHSKGPEIRDGMDLSSSHTSNINKPTPDRPYTRSAGCSDVARLRELGLITTEDFDRVSSTKDGDGINPDDSMSQQENQCCRPPRLTRQNAFCFESNPAMEELASPFILEYYFNAPQYKVNVCTWSEDSGDADDLQHRHSTGPYTGESRKFSLKTDNDDEGERLAEITCKTEEAVQAQGSIINGMSSAVPTNGPSRPQESLLQGACADILPSKPLHGKLFKLTPSEASEETAESLRTGGGNLVQMHEAGVGRTAVFHNADLQPSPQAVHVEGAFGRDGDIQIPIFPYTHRSTRCRALNCPIRGKHEKGPYLHEGKLRVKEGNIFGASNPPRQIWEAYDRIKDKDGSLGGREKDKVAARDVKLVTSFARHHFGEAIEWGVGASESVYRADGFIIV